MRPRYRDGCEGESPISEPGWTVVSLTSTAPQDVESQRLYEAGAETIRRGADVRPSWRKMARV